MNQAIYHMTKHQREEIEKLHQQVILMKTKNEIISSSMLSVALNSHTVEKYSLHNLHTAIAPWVCLQKEIACSQSLQEIVNPMRKMRDLFHGEISCKIKKENRQQHLFIENLEVIYKNSRLAKPETLISHKQYLHAHPAQIPLPQNSSLFLDLFRLDLTMGKLHKLHKKTYDLCEHQAHLLEHHLKELEAFEDNLQYATQLCEKYGFKSLDFQQIPGYEAKDFLKNLDNSLEDLCTRLEAPAAIVSLNGRLSMATFRGIKDSRYSACAFYQSENRAIVIDQEIDQHPTTLLHEWVHAVDGFIGEVKGRNIFSSDEKLHFNKPLVGNDQSLVKAHYVLKDIIHHVKYDHANQLIKWQSQKRKDAMGIFWYCLLGDSWFTMQDDKRNLMMQANIVDALDNYAMKPSKANAKILSEFIRPHLALSLQEAMSLISEKRTYIIKNIAPLFSQIHQPSSLPESKLIKGFNGFFAYVHFLAESIRINIENPKTITCISDYINKEVKYYSNDAEMLARYFERQVYPKEAKKNSYFLLDKYGKTDDSFNARKNLLLSYMLPALGLSPLPSQDKKKKNKHYNE